MTKIECDRVSFAYPGQRQAAGSGFSLKVEPGETVLLLGPSGSGKSTLALCLCGLIPHAVVGRLDGEVRIDGLDTRLIEPGELACTVGTVFQDPEAQSIMATVEEEVAFGLENVGVPTSEMRGRIADALHAVSLSGFEGEPVDRLSGGQKQRLALASVLAMKPEILVLDEPTSNLDPVGTEDLFRKLGELKKTGRYTMVLIEHKLDELLELVDLVAVIDEKGGLLCSGAPSDVFYEHAEELAHLGVWVPAAVELARGLSGHGLPPESRPLSIRQLADAVQSFLPAGLSAPAKIGRRQAADSSPLLDIRATGPLSPGNGWLQPFSLEVRRGQFWAVVGGNGAGKTTLARHLAGLLPIRSGVAFLEGRDCGTYSARELAGKIGYVFQNPEHQFVTERVGEEIAFGLRASGMPEAEVAETVARYLARFGLSDYADVHPFRLSHGEKRRLSVAAMLVAGQELMILDEPTFGQDRRHAIELMEMMKELQREGRTIMMITHDMSLVAEYAEQAAVFGRGELLSAGPVERLFADYGLLGKAGLKLPPVAELWSLLANKTASVHAPAAWTRRQWQMSWDNACSVRAGTVS